MTSRAVIRLCGAAVTAALGGFCVMQAAFSRTTADSQPDFLIVLGCTVNGDEPCETLVTRMEAAAEFLKKNPETRAVCCGGLVKPNQTKSEAQVIYDFLAEQGVEACRLLLEDKSTTTKENFVNAEKIMRRESGGGQYSAAVLTSEFHIMRSMMISRFCRVRVQAVAARSPRGQLLKNYVRELAVFPLTLADCVGSRVKKA